jgi:protein gp37
MADQRNGGIAWTDATWNPLRGCSRVSEGCRNCYAESMAGRFCGPGMAFEGVAKRVDGKGRWTGDVKLIEERLTDPLHWRKPRKVFVNSVSDLFHPAVPDEWIDRIFAVMALSPQHTFQVLTKRPERMREYVAHACGRVAETIIRFRRERGDPNMAVIPLPHIRPGYPWWPLPNVWLGVSVENQPAADERIPHLLRTPAAVWFVSCEPLLGPVELTCIRQADDVLPGQDAACGWYIDSLVGDAWDDENGALTGEYRQSFGSAKINWVIVGGESGPNARPMNPDWTRSLRDQCADAKVPFMFKQWGEWLCSDSVDQPAYRGEHRYLGDHQHAYRVGKKSAGRLLDGVDHNEFPEVRT